MNSLSVIDVNTVINQNANNLLDIKETMPLEQLPVWGFTLAAAVLFSIGFFGFFLNLFVIILMCKDTQVSDKLSDSLRLSLSRTTKSDVL